MHQYHGFAVRGDHPEKIAGGAPDFGGNLPYLSDRIYFC